MDPSKLLSIISICKNIYDQVEKSEANNYRVIRLKERVQSIHIAIDNLIKKIDTEKKELGDVKQKKYSEHPYSQPLEALERTLIEALELIGRFSKRDIFLAKIIQAGFYDEEFSNINEKLSEELIQLGLGLNVADLFDKEQDKKDRENDVKALLSIQDEILAIMMDSKQKMQKLEVHDEEQKQLMNYQFESLRLEMRELFSGKKRNISTKILIRFYDLDIDKLLGAGSFGKIYKGRWLGQDVAIKMIEGKLDSLKRKEFIREIKIMKRLRSDFVMPLYAACDEPGRACLVMKYMSQGSLRSILDKKIALTNQQKEQFILDIALGLNYLHSLGIIHRDFKSSSVLVDSYWRAKISNFDLSKIEQTLSTTLGKRTEYIKWLAPEILLSPLDNHIFSKASDVYSFGVVVWEILTGKSPYENIDIVTCTKKIMSYENEFIPDTIPEFYKKLLTDCWNRNRAYRPLMSDIIVRLHDYQVIEQEIHKDISSIHISSTFNSASLSSSSNWASLFSHSTDSRIKEVQNKIQVILDLNNEIGENEKFDKKFIDYYMAMDIEIENRMRESEKRVAEKLNGKLLDELQQMENHLRDIIAAKNAIVVMSKTESKEAESPPRPAP